MHIFAHIYQESEAENLREVYVSLLFYFFIAVIFFVIGVCWELLCTLVSFIVMLLKDID